MADAAGTGEGAGEARPSLGRYHRPVGGRLGDAIPFYWEGVWHVFYLDYKRDYWDHTPPGARHTTWAHVTSTNLEDWRLEPVAISPGPEGAVDSGSCATGSIFAGPHHGQDGLFHLFYTGRYFTTEGGRRETICHATSTDLRTWRKDDANPLARPDPERYSLEHWRDPFVLWNEDAGEYWMVVTAALKDAPAARRGCLGLMASLDLVTWEHRGPFWTPHGTSLPECPDVFHWGEWWYLVYSANAKTVYRRARDLAGPWWSAPMEAFDDRFFYAAKSAGDERRRLLFGWLAVKRGHVDDGAREWGGDLAVREVVQRPDGALSVALPREHLLAGATPLAVTEPRLGDWSRGSAGIHCAPTDGFACATVDAMPPDAQLRVRVAPDRETRAVGLLLRTSAELTRGYGLRLDLSQRRLTLGSVSASGRLNEELAQPLPAAREYDCVVTMDGSVLDAVVTGEGESEGGVSLIGRFHAHRGAVLGLFVEEGSATFRDLTTAPLKGVGAHGPDGNR